jgi:NAD(P)-dependent dehydrogenase (short-subunit alcohol dehydrogenase family)
VDDNEKFRVSSLQRFSYGQLDVSNRQAVEQVLPGAVMEFGPPDILINCAGISNPQEFENTSYTNQRSPGAATQGLMPMRFRSCKFN